MKKELIYLLVVVLSITSFSCNKDDANVVQEPLKSSAKQITGFVFKANSNSLLGADIIATIDESAKSIIATVSYSSNASSLIPSIEVSTGATISPDGDQDFNNPVTFTVTAEDGSTAKYEVNLEITVTERESLIAIFNANPNNTLDWDLQDKNINNWDGVFVNANGNITQLIIDSKGLDVLPSEIKSLTMLIELDVNDNKLTELPVEIWQLTNMIYLTLDENQLTDLPIEIEQLINLTDLYASNNKLTKLPEQIGNLSKLDYLGLSDNTLTELPALIGLLTNLTVLKIEKNELIKLPQEIGQLDNLISLTLNNNALSELPEQIGQLNMLSGLSISNNALTELPVQIGQLKSLSYLDLRDNNLVSIPQAVCDLQNTGTQVLLDDGVICE